MPRLTTTPPGGVMRAETITDATSSPQRTSPPLKFPNPIGELITSSRGIVTITASNRRDYCYSLRAFCQTEKILC